MTILALILAFMFLAAGVPAALATVEEDWPAGTPNTPRSPGDIFLDFESGLDGMQVESSIPSLKFTATSGLDWQYGDIRTDAYNVYPYGDGTYETNGDFFAWLGETGDSGRIDFLGGGATYCSLLTSTYSGLTLDAYDQDGNLLSSSGWATGNTDTGTFTRLTVDAPAGKTMAYVVMHDTGNFWLIDDLCTDAEPAVSPVPGRGNWFTENCFDLVFVPDEDYGSAADVAKWLPTFLAQVNGQIDKRLGGFSPVSGHLDKFNFYYTTLQGLAGTFPRSRQHISPRDRETGGPVCRRVRDSA